MEDNQKVISWEIPSFNQLIQKVNKNPPQLIKLATVIQSIAIPRAINVHLVFTRPALIGSWDHLAIQVIVRVD